MLKCFLIAICGAAGSLCRYGAVSFFCPSPWGTLAVNVAGAFLAGFLGAKIPADWAYRPCIFAGFLGAFTTFSTMMLECAGFLQSGAYGRGALYLCLSNLGGLLAVLLGLILGR